MGIFMRNHELLEFGAYPYGYASEVDAWREVAEDCDRYTFVSISSQVSVLGDDLDSYINLTKEPVTEDLESSLLELSISLCPYPQKVPRLLLLPLQLVETDDCTSNSSLSVASFLAARQQFRAEDLYQYNWYREFSSEIYNLVLL
ncbi:hypothetical protein AYI68_g3017 [Smittium mucronatum]|uniref:Uncharacterized protein n=1 Tax=Smittium mucronatum TaxID=133383 RepID=A0A1R0H142_9FUNG|nr:hypothetical protein AYI68_g3017 [Smittium mucronatum]